MDERQHRDEREHGRDPREQSDKKERKRRRAEPIENPELGGRVCGKTAGLFAFEASPRRTGDTSTAGEFSKTAGRLPSRYTVMSPTLTKVCGRSGSRSLGFSEAKSPQLSAR